MSSFLVVLGASENEALVVVTGSTGVGSGFATAATASATTVSVTLGASDASSTISAVWSADGISSIDAKPSSKRSSKLRYVRAKRLKM